MSDEESMVQPPDTTTKSDTSKTTSTTSSSSASNSDDDELANLVVEDPNCAGKVVGGYCWYATSKSQSCNEVCQSHSGVNDATKTFVGSTGSIQNCKSVLDALALGGTSGSVVSSKGTSYGCYYSDMQRQRYWSAGIDYSNKAVYAQIACACNK